MFQLINLTNKRNYRHNLNEIVFYYSLFLFYSLLVKGEINKNISTVNIYKFIIFKVIDATPVQPTTTAKSYLADLQNYVTGIPGASGIKIPTPPGGNIFFISIIRNKKEKDMFLERIFSFCFISH